MNWPFAAFRRPWRAPTVAPAASEASESAAHDVETWPLPDGAVPVHVVGDHAMVRLKDGRLSIAVEGAEPAEVRIDDVASLLVHGNTVVSTPALLALMRRGVPILWHGFDGRLVGQTTAIASASTSVREAQYRAAADPHRTQVLARSLVAAKLSNSRRLLLRRFGKTDPAVRRIGRLYDQLPHARDLDHVRGLEGAAADAYFSAWPRMIDASRGHLRFGGRSRRPPADGPNAALSYLYAVLHGRCAAAAVAAGLDPAVGFLHARRPGRASLALDLMEPFRPLVVDACLVAAFNNGEFPPAAFETLGAGAGEWRLSAQGRRTALQALERRLAQSAADGESRGGLTYRDAISRQAGRLAQALRRDGPFVAFEPRR
jgi:CRISPR-associated protein Cas1